MAAETTSARRRTPADPAPADPATPPAETAPETPDTEPEGVPVHVAWNRVMRDVQKIGKDSRNRDQGFMFRGIDAVMSNVGPAFRRHGVFVMPTTILELREERYDSKNGAKMHAVILTIGWTIVGPLGDTMAAQSVGQAADSGDKVVSKAHSVAMRTLLLEGLCIPTGDPDPDETTHERASGSDTRPSGQQGQAARPAAPQSPDPRQRLWVDIMARGKSTGLTEAEMRDDFRSWSATITADGSALEIDGPLETTTHDVLTRYYQQMRQPDAAAPAAADEPTEAGTQ